MDRRRFVGGVALGCIVAPLPGRAQQAAKVPRIALLTAQPIESPGYRVLRDSLRKGLREHGYVEGKNIIVEYRSAGGSLEQIPALAGELARLQVEVIVTGSSPLALAVRQVTTTIPIVATVMGDPVEEGLAASLARPGGNVTGLTYLGPELIPKRLELLKQMLPSATRAAAIWHRDVFGAHPMNELLNEAKDVARMMGVQLQLVEVRGPGELEVAFSTIVREHPDALVVFPSPALYSAQERIVELAAKHRLPSIYFAREFVAIGGLISYGPSIADLFRRGATYVDKILKGAKPGNLPIEQPTTFELVINLKTAQALGITIPQSLLVRAEEVIQ